MKLILSNLAVVVLLSLPSVIDAQPQCAFTIDGDDATAPGNSGERRQATFAVPPGLANRANEFKVCDGRNPAKDKTFKVVHSTDFGPAGGQPLESWSGQADDGSELSFVVDERGYSTGSLIDPNAKTITDLFTSEDGTAHSVTKSVNDYPDEADPLDEGVDLTVDPEDLNRRLRGSITNAAGTNSDNDHHQKQDHRHLQTPAHTLDVLVLYTAAARTRKGGSTSQMTAAIALAITETNDAYASSGVNAQLNLVHAAETSYVEASTDAFGSALSALRTTTDGIMDNVHSLRSQYGADVVALIIDDPAYCGLGYLGPRSDLMFSVTGANCMTGYYSFGHEIGHNLGCHHDRTTVTSEPCDSPKYNFGWRDPNANFRSIMAYNCGAGGCDNNVGGGCTRVKMFSNPNFPYGTTMIGNAANDNARIINEVAADVAGYYSASPTPSPPTNPPPTNPPPTNPPAPTNPPPTNPPPTNPPPTPAPPPTNPPPAVTKYICHNKFRDASTICVDGTTSSCGAQGDTCGNGGKFCQVATCGGGSPPAPAPTNAPPPPSPTASCFGSGSSCSAGTCCNGCQTKGRWAGTCK